MSSRLTMRSHDHRVTYNRVATTQPCSSFVPLVSSSSPLLSFAVHGLLSPPRLPCTISPVALDVPSPVNTHVSVDHLCTSPPLLRLHVTLKLNLDGGLLT